MPSLLASRSSSGVDNGEGGSVEIDGHLATINTRHPSFYLHHHYHYPSTSTTTIATHKQPPITIRPHQPPVTMATRTTHDIVITHNLSGDVEVPGAAGIFDTGNGISGINTGADTDANANANGTSAGANTGTGVNGASFSVTSTNGSRISVNGASISLIAVNGSSISINGASISITDANGTSISFTRAYRTSLSRLSVVITSNHENQVHHIGPGHGGARAPGRARDQAPNQAEAQAHIVHQAALALARGLQGEGQGGGTESITTAQSVEAVHSSMD